MAERMMPEKQPIDWPLLSLLYFSQMGAEASKPGATVLGSMASAASAPAAYLMQQSKSQREHESKIPALALKILDMGAKGNKEGKKPVKKPVRYYLPHGMTMPSNLNDPDSDLMNALPGAERLLTPGQVTYLTKRNIPVREAFKRDENGILRSPQMVIDAVRTKNQGKTFDPESMDAVKRWLVNKRLPRQWEAQDGNLFEKAKFHALTGESFPRNVASEHSDDVLKSIVEVTSKEKDPNHPQNTPGYIYFDNFLNASRNNLEAAVAAAVADESNLYKRYEANEGQVEQLQDAHNQGRLKRIAGRDVTTAKEPTLFEVKAARSKGFQQKAGANDVSSLLAAGTADAYQDAFISGIKDLKSKIDAQSREINELNYPEFNYSDQGVRKLSIGTKTIKPLQLQVALNLNSAWLGMDEVEKVYKLLFPNGKFSKITVAFTEDLPVLKNAFMNPYTGYLPSKVIESLGGPANVASKARRAFYSASRAIELILRARSGAAVPFHEVRNYLDWYMPNVWDDEKSAKDKLDGMYKHFLLSHRLLSIGRTIPEQTYESMGWDVDRINQKRFRIQPGMDIFKLPGVKTGRSPQQNELARKVNAGIVARAISEISVDRLERMTGPEIMAFSQAIMQERSSLPGNLDKLNEIAEQLNEWRPGNIENLEK
jgi:hypothetical protein